MICNKNRTGAKYLWALRNSESKTLDPFATAIFSPFSPWHWGYVQGCLLSLCVQWISWLGAAWNWGLALMHSIIWSKLCIRCNALVFANLGRISKWCQSPNTLGTGRCWKKSKCMVDAKIPGRVKRKMATKGPTYIDENPLASEEPQIPLILKHAGGSRNGFLCKRQSVSFGNTALSYIIVNQ